MAGISSRAAGGVENKRKYNGIENENTLDLNIGEAFFRTHDHQLGRWWQVDPKADSLLGLSPYNAMVNKPISIKDPKGDIIEFDKIASAEYKAKVLVSAVTLLVKGVGGNLLQLAGSERTYKFSETTGSSGFGGNKDGTGGRMVWNPNQALLTTNHVKLSATTILNHELDHAAQYDKDPVKYFAGRKSPNHFDAQYDNIEEKRVVTGSEQRTAFAMGEIKRGQVTRTDHISLSIINTKWPNSTTGTVESTSEPLQDVIVTPKKLKSKN